MEKPHPDVAEVLAYNKASCKHLNKIQQTRWLGGRPGVYGGMYPQEWMWCPDCEEWVDTVPPYDDLAKFVESWCKKFSTFTIE